ncbi:thioredoxin family protein [bacterium]|nr:thioredoxin family protein [bacterium]
MSRAFRSLLSLGFLAVTNFVMAEANLGSAAPTWKDLPGTDGKKHSSTELKDKKAVVVAFTCNHCPVAVAYEDRFIAFAKEYAPKGVEFVAINVSNIDDDKLPKMTERAKEKGFNFPYLYDASQKVGKDFGAEKTPHLFVLDGEGKVVFVGAFDDKMDAKKVSKHYVKDAVDAVLSGKEPEVNKTPAHGCGIQYED